MNRISAKATLMQTYHSCLFTWNISQKPKKQLQTNQFQILNAKQFFFFWFSLYSLEKMVEFSFLDLWTTFCLIMTHQWEKRFCENVSKFSWAFIYYFRAVFCFFVFDSLVWGGVGLWTYVEFWVLNLCLYLSITLSLSIFSININIPPIHI